MDTRTNSRGGMNCPADIGGQMKMTGISKRGRNSLLLTEASINRLIWNTASMTQKFAKRPTYLPAMIPTNTGKTKSRNSRIAVSNISVLRTTFERLDCSLYYTLGEPQFCSYFAL